MKKVIPVVITVVLIAGGIGIYLITKKDATKTDTTSQQKSSTTSFKVINACDALLQTDADAILGTGAKKTDSSSGATSSSDVQVTTCGYFVSTPTYRSAMILARAAKTDDGAETNKTQFASGKPTDAITVNGFGDAAYWSPTYGQLNILAHNNWYILTNGTGRPADAKVDDARALATQVMARL